jgi:hypothetical protein
MTAKARAKATPRNADKELDRYGKPIADHLAVIVPVRFSRDQYRALSQAADVDGERFLTRYIRQLISEKIQSFHEPIPDVDKKRKRG